MPPTSNSSGGVPGQPVQVQAGWAYAVLPPLWPIGSTPGERGGVRLASAAPLVHAVFVAEQTIDRIFFIGGRDAAGEPVACTLTVESIDAPGVPPQSLDILEGWLVERPRNPFSTTPPQLRALQFSNLPATHPFRVFLSTVQPGQSGKGGIGSNTSSTGVLSATSVSGRPVRVDGGISSVTS